MTEVSQVNQTKVKSPVKQPVDGLGTAGLVTGILSIVFFWLWPLAIILGVLGVVFGIISYRKSRSGVALAGAICGGVGVILAVVFIVAAVTWVDSNKDFFREVEGSHYYR